MNKLIPLMLGLTLMSGSMAMAAPASSVAKTQHKVAIKKHAVKKTSLKKSTGKTVISKK